MIINKTSHFNYSIFISVRSSSLSIVKRFYPGGKPPKLPISKEMPKLPPQQPLQSLKPVHSTSQSPQQNQQTPRRAIPEYTCPKDQEKAAQKTIREAYEHKNYTQRAVTVEDNKDTTFSSTPVKPSLHETITKKYDYQPQHDLFPTKIRHHKGDPIKAYIESKSEETKLELKKQQSPENIKACLMETLTEEKISKIKEAVVTIRLKPGTQGDDKHVNFGTISPEKPSIVVYGALTSSKDANAKTGQSTSFKISESKLDGSFIKEPYVDIQKKNGETIFVAGDKISTDTAGQRARVFHQPREYFMNDGTFEISSLGMDYLEEIPTAESNLQQLINIVNENQKETKSQKEPDPTISKKQ